MSEMTSDPAIVASTTTAIMSARCRTASCHSAPRAGITAPAASAARLGTPALRSA